MTVEKIQPARGVAIVILAVEDLQRAVTFYKTAFAGAELVTAPHYVELTIGGTTSLGLYERVAFARNVGRTPRAPSAGDISGTELYFRVDSLPDAIAALEAAGAKQLSPAETRPWGEIAAYFSDPDGNVLAVAAPA